MGHNGATQGIETQPFITKISTGQERLLWNELIKDLSSVSQWSTSCSRWVPLLFYRGKGAFAVLHPAEDVAVDSLVAHEACA